MLVSNKYIVAIVLKISLVWLHKPCSVAILLIDYACALSHLRTYMAVDQDNRRPLYIPLVIVSIIAAVLVVIIALTCCILKRRRSTPPGFGNIILIDKNFVVLTHSLIASYVKKLTSTTILSKILRYIIGRILLGRSM